MKAKFFLLSLTLLTSAFAYAQDLKSISGVVSDINGLPLPGASVQVINGNSNDITDFDGNFNLEAAIGNQVQISFIGFKTQFFTVTVNKVYTINLQEDTQALDEVFVVGYGTQRKADVTGSIAQVGADEIVKQPALNAIQSIQGKAAGVQITPSGAPGSSPTVIIRGLGTAFGGQNPLYVVDGVITTNIDNISPNDITSIDILKDASSLAIYGNRGANGVIVVTTKRGKIGKTNISYNVYSGFRKEIRTVDLANAQDYVTYFNEAAINEAGPDEEPNVLDIDQLFNTNWFDAITRTGVITNHNFSISGGNESVTSFFSADFLDEQGILIGNDFNRLTLRSNNDLNLNDRIKFTQQASVTLTDADPQPFSAFTNAYRQAPIIPVRFPEGDEFEGQFGAPLGLNNVANPVSQLFFNNQKVKNLNLQGTLGFEFKVTDWLQVNSRIGIETAYGRNFNFIPNRELFLAADPTNTIEEYALQETTINTLAVNHNNNYRFNVDNFVTLSKAFNKLHEFKLVLGTTIEEQRAENLFALRENVPPQEDFFSLNNGDNDETQQGGGGFTTKQRLRSYFARLNYDYDSKYLFTGTYRRDGSSQFQDGFRFGNFFSVGLGWVISNEAFLEDNTFINRLKLRGSFGELGNQNVPFNQVLFNTGLNFPFGPNQTINQGSTSNQIVDPSLTWETTEELDIGLEFALFNSRLTGEVDYYNRLNRDAILPIEFPDTVGAAGNTFTSAGQVRNKGLEITLNWSDTIGKDWSYSIGGNISFNENELETITNSFFAESVGGNLGNGQNVKRVEVGQPLGSFNLFNVEGIDQETGEFIFEDTDGDGEITEDDRQFFGSFQPTTFYGVNININYKNIDFSIDGYGTAGSFVYNGKAAQRFGGENIEQRIFDNRFTFANPSNTNPIANNDVPLASNFYLESGNFFKINNITLGYTLPIRDKFILSKVRVYATAQQPIIWQAFSGFTPELPGDPLGNAGIELNAYPNVSSYLLGLNVNF